jgi:hypothetical protein
LSLTTEDELLDPRARRSITEHDVPRDPSHRGFGRSGPADHAKQTSPRHTATRQKPKAR